MNFWRGLALLFLLLCPRTNQLNLCPASFLLLLSCSIKVSLLLLLYDWEGSVLFLEFCPFSVICYCSFQTYRVDPLSHFKWNASSNTLPTWDWIYELANSLEITVAHLKPHWHCVDEWTQRNQSIILFSFHQRFQLEISFTFT